MACLGVLFSLEEEEVVKLKSLDSDEDRLAYLQEDIEERYFELFPSRIAELDKSWDALHRSLTDGRLTYDNGEFPDSHVVLGGEILYSAGDYIMTLKSPEEVGQIAKRLKELSEASFRDKYFKLDAEEYGFPLTEEDFMYTWEWLERSLDFWMQAAKEGRHVLFTADQ
jgi:hypothetical protein